MKSLAFLLDLGTSLRHERERSLGIAGDGSPPTVFENISIFLYVTASSCSDHHLSSIPVPWVLKQLHRAHIINNMAPFKGTAPAPTEGDISSSNPSSSPSPVGMASLKDTAPAPTEGDIGTSSSSSSPVNVTPSRDATAATSAAQQGDNIAHALAGAGGGLLAMTLTYPLITISTRAQVESKRADTSTIAAVKHIINREGITGLYAGLDSALFGISVTNFVYYYWYEWTRAFFEKAAIKSGRASKKLTTIESILAGAVAGSATVLTTNPIWVVNTRMTARKNENDDSELPGGEKKKTTTQKKPSTIGTLMALIKDEGVGSLMAGVLPALVLVINPILQYTFYEQMRNVVEKRRKVTPRDAFYLGALGKLLATTITYPYITVKSRAHVATKEKPAEPMSKSLQVIVKEEGWAGLYKGMWSI